LKEHIVVKISPDPSLPSGPEALLGRRPKRGNSSLSYERERRRRRRDLMSRVYIIKDCVINLRVLL